MIDDQYWRSDTDSFHNRHIRSSSYCSRIMSYRRRNCAAEVRGDLHSFGSEKRRVRPNVIFGVTPQIVTILVRISSVHCLDYCSNLAHCKMCQWCTVTTARSGGSGMIEQGWCRDLAARCESLSTLAGEADWGCQRPPAPTLLRLLVTDPAAAVTPPSTLALRRLN